MESPRNNRPDITGVILVGGKSSRMGKDKAFLEFSGKSLFEWVLELHKASFQQIMLVGERPERFAAYDLQVVEDVYPGSALGGLYTGLCHAQTEYIFVSPCDLPFPSKRVLDHICSLRNGMDAVVPATRHGFEPLFALYGKKCVESMRNLLEGGNLCIYDFFPQVRTRYVSTGELAPLDRDGKSFRNINTPEEYSRLEKGSLT